MPVEAPTWLNPGDNAWQMTAATFVGLMSLPGLAVLYGGVMQKRWSVNSMMLTFVGVLASCSIVWVLCGVQDGLRHALPSGCRTTGFFGTFIGQAGTGAEPQRAAGPGEHPARSGRPPFHFPKSSLVYFQFVFAAITPILMLGSVLGRVNFKAWIPFVLLWITFVYTVNAFLIWGGGYFGQHGALDYSGGYVIHLAAGVSGFVAAAVIGPTPAARSRDRRAEQPAMVAVGAGSAVARLERVQRRRPSTRRNCRPRAAVLNTNLCTAVAFLVWIGWDYILPAASLR